MTRHLLAIAALAVFACATPQQVVLTLPSHASVDAEVARAMAASGAQGMAVAVIDEGRVVYVNAYGRRNAAGEPLQTDTIMYGASLTKVAFAYMVTQLVEEGAIDLDTTIDHYLARPLLDYTEPEVEDLYARWSDLAGDERWRSLTPRILLTHSSGFANFGFLEPDGRLRIHFDPGTHYSYSGDGIILLQFVLEQGLGLDVGREMQRRVFDRFGMANTSMMWRADFASNLADGWALDGSTEPHDERSAVRAAGSMDTTIADFAQFAAGFVRGDGVTRATRAEIVRPMLPITVASQFPVLQPELPPALRRPDLASGLGVLTFAGPQGPGFMRGGHNDWTGNIWVCIEARRRCVVVLSNDVRAESEFARIVAFVLGETGAPWDFVYGSGGR
ncbi:MAG: serine hydrolase domain-containing protein [Terricaulis sp.]